MSNIISQGSDQLFSIVLGLTFFYALTTGKFRFHDSDEQKTHDEIKTQNDEIKLQLGKLRGEVASIQRDISELRSDLT